jgi:beta-glucosidase
VSAAADTSVVPSDGDLGVTVTLRNAGPRAGREVVQVYVEPLAAEASRPVRTLAAFTAATAEPGGDRRGQAGGPGPGLRPLRRERQRLGLAAGRVRHPHRPLIG